MEFLIGGAVIGSVFTMVALAAVMMKMKVELAQAQMMAVYYKGKYELIQDSKEIQKLLEDAYDEDGE